MFYNCPVCDKAGLQDFRSNHVICPQCNTDLKPYMLLSNFVKKQSPRKSYASIIAAIILGITSIGLGILYFNKKSEPALIANASPKIDSIGFYKKENQRLKEGTVDVVNSDAFVLKYKVKYRDNLSKIAKFFYGDWMKYKQIESDNNLIAPYTLRVGQILLIKLKN